MITFSCITLPMFWSIFINKLFFKHKVEWNLFFIFCFKLYTSIIERITIFNFLVVYRITLKGDFSLSFPTPRPNPSSFLSLSFWHKNFCFYVMIPTPIYCYKDDN